MLKDGFVEKPCIDLQRQTPVKGEPAMKTNEIETEMLLQEMAAIRCKVEELNEVVRSYTRGLLSREHDVAAWMEATQVARSDCNEK